MPPLPYKGALRLRRNAGDRGRQRRRAIRVPRAREFEVYCHASVLSRNGCGTATGGGIFNSRVLSMRTARRCYRLPIFAGYEHIREIFHKNMLIYKKFLKKYLYIYKKFGKI